MAAAALRKSGKSKPGKNQSWSPNSGQVTENGTQISTGVLDSEHDQQAPAGSLMLPQPQNDQIGQETQSASSLVDQPQGAQVQYQPAGKRPYTADCGSTSLLGTIQLHVQGKPLAPTATVDAQP